MIHVKNKTLPLRDAVVVGLITVLLSVPCLCAQATQLVVATLPVEPETSYRLKFQAQGGSDNTVWLLRTTDSDGEIPHAGCYEWNWQKIVPDTTIYAHVFRTPPNAESLEFSIRSDGKQPQISEVTLDAITPEGLLINGDFPEEADNWSGWSEHNNTSFIEIDGKTALKIEHNGYALTDPLPVVGGELYEFTRGSTMPGHVLAYTADMHLLTPTRFERKIQFKTPDNAAYLRLLYQTGFDHIPIYRTNTIKGVGLHRVSDETPVARTAVPRLPGEIVLSGDCDAREEYAARELQHWVQEITGKRLPLLAAPSPADNSKIFLGAAWAKKYADDLKFLAGSDGYALRTDGKHIHVFGSHPRGTLFGVYALLEKNTDIIWPRPSPEFAALFSKADKIDFTNADVRSRPAFKIREINFAGGDPNPELSQDWIGHNGGNSPLKLGKGFPYLQWRSGALIGDGGGYIWKFLGLEQEDETLYPLVNGNRLRNMWRQPCYTHPDVPRIMADSARKFLASVPGEKLEFLISRVGDNWEVCNCPECMKPIELEDGTRLVAESGNSVKNQLFFSTRNFMMLNRMAENLVEDYPDLELHTHAYIFTAEPPKVKLHPTIVPHFAAYPTKDERYPILEQKTERGEIWGTRMRQWAAEQEVKFGFFGYYYAGGFNALADTAGPDYKALAEMGGIHAHNEGNQVDGDALSSWDVDGCEKWIISKLQWDPTQNPAALRDEYITRTYRDAAPKMREFYQLINAVWHDESNPTAVNCHTPSKQLFQEFIVNSGKEKRLRALLVEAQETASDPKSQKMITRTLAKFDELAADLSRLPVLLVPESTEQWNQHESPHWYKAHEIGDFKRIPNSQPLPDDSPTKHQTKIAMMRDKDTMYFKIDAFSELAKAGNPPTKSTKFPQGDRVEIVLRSGKNTYYLAVGQDGGTYLLKNWNTSLPWENQVQAKHLALDGKWSSLLAIPLSDLGAASGVPDLDSKFCRVVNPTAENREESTYDGRGIFNNHEMLRSPMKFDE